MWNFYQKFVTYLTWLLAALAGICLLAIMIITGADILLRRLDSAVHGAIDIVQILGCLCIVLSLPYTTAVKGHIAVEFLFRKFNHVGKIIADSFTRCLSIAFFSALAWRSFQYGFHIYRKNALTLTLNIPLFWVYWLASLSFCTVVLVIFYHLTHPGKEMIRP